MTDMPRTKAGKKLLRDMGFSTRAWSDRADRMAAYIVAIEAESARDSAGLDVERLAKAMEREPTYLAALTKRFGRFNGAWYDKAAEAIAAEYAALSAPQEETK